MSDSSAQEVGPTAAARAITGTAIVLLAVAAAVLSLLAERPNKLPSVALGSDAVLYAERAGALFAVFLFILIVIQRGFREGRLPDEISGRGIKYAERKTVSELKGTTQDALRATEQLLVLTRQELMQLQAEVRGGHGAPSGTQPKGP